MDSPRHTRIMGFRVYYNTNTSRGQRGLAPIYSPQLETMEQVHKCGPQSSMLGIVNDFAPCGLCRQTTLDRCRGHMGRFTTIPYYVNPYLSHNLATMLSLTCGQCYKINIPKKKLMGLSYNVRDIRTIYQLLTEAHKFVGVHSHCDNCGATNVLYTKYSSKLLYPTLHVIASKGAAPQMASSKTLFELHNMLLMSNEWNMFDNDLYLTFIDQCFCHNLLVTPVTHRPFVTNNLNDTHQISFITLMYASVMKAVQEYKQKKDRSGPEMLEANKVVFDNIMGLISGDPHTMSTDARNAFDNNGPLINFSSKSGFIRKNMIAKNVSMGVRGVAICDATLKPGWISLPQQTAHQLQCKQFVRSYNIVLFSSFYRDGTKWPSIHKITRDGVHYTDVIEGFGVMELQEGDLIMRDMIDNDILLTHRPPALINTNIHTDRVLIERSSDSTSSGIAMNPTEMSETHSGDMDGDTLSGMTSWDTMVQAEAQCLLTLDINGRSTTNSNSLCSMTNNGRIGPMIATLYNYSMSPTLASSMILSLDLPLKQTQEMISIFMKSARTMKNFIELGIPKYLTMSHIPIYSNLQINTSNNQQHKLEIVNGEIKQGLIDPTCTDGNSSDSLTEYIYGHEGGTGAIDRLHTLRRLAEVLTASSCFGYNTSAGRLSTEFMTYIRSHEALRIQCVKESLKVLDGLPTQTSLIGTDLAEVRCFQHLDPGVYMDGLMSDLSDGYQNQMLALVVAQTKKTGAMSLNIGIGGAATIRSAMPPMIQNNRIYSIHKSLSVNPLDKGYMSYSQAAGMRVNDVALQSRVGMATLCERRFNASKPGVLSRYSKIALSGLRTSAYCHIIDGSLHNNPRLVASTYGSSNSLTEHAQKESIGWLMSNTPTSMAPLFELPDKSMSSTFDTYTKWYNEFEYGYNTSMNLPQDNIYFHTLEVLCAPRKMSMHTYITKTVSPNTDCHDKLCRFIQYIDYIFLGYEAYKDKIYVPPYMSESVLVQKMLIMIEFPPKRIETWDKNEFNNILMFMQKKMLNAMICPYSAAGLIAASNITAPLTQQVLDAPKSKTGVAEELDKYHNTISISKVPGQFDNVFCIVDKFIDTYTTYVEHTINELQPRVAIYKNIPKQYTEKLFYIPDMNNEKTYYILLYIEMIKILAMNMTVGTILVVLASHPSIYFTIINQTDDWLVLLMICNIPHNIDGPTIMGSLIKILSEVRINGTPGIRSIKMKTNEITIYKNGVKTVEPRHVLIVNTNSIDALLSIEGTSAYNILFENPALHKHYMGIISAEVTAHHFISSMFPSQSMTHSQNHAKAMTILGRFVPINRFMVKDIWPEHILQDAAMASPNQVLRNAPKNISYAKADDPLSAMMIGTCVPMGSGVVAIVQTPVTEDIIKTDIEATESSETTEEPAGKDYNLLQQAA